MRKFGLVGCPLGHSFSSQYFNDKFKSEGIDAVYNNYELKTLDDLRSLVENEGLEGLNVTIPYKIDVISYLDDIDFHADSIGAVNVIKVFDVDGQKFLKGYNTDYLAFRKSIIPLMQAQHVSALILGTGGAAHAVAYALTQIGIECVFVSRHESAESIFYKEVNEKVMSRFKIIVNCTPVGMFPKVNGRPNIPYEFITNEHLLYDLIYNPEQTKFLSLGEKHEAQTKNGLEMLYLQADESWNIWNNAELI